MCHHFTYLGDKVKTFISLNCLLRKKMQHFYVGNCVNLYSHSCYFPTKVTTILYPCPFWKEKRGKKSKNHLRILSTLFIYCSLFFSLSYPNLVDKTTSWQLFTCKGNSEVNTNDGWQDKSEVPLLKSLQWHLLYTVEAMGKQGSLYKVQHTTTTKKAIQK